MSPNIVVGRSPILGPRAGAASGWTGLLLTLDTIDAWMTVASGAIMPVIWENVDPVSTPGIVSTGPHTLSAETIPAGSAGVVPAGMAGKWRVSGSLAFSGADTTVAISSAILLNNSAVDYASLMSVEPVTTFASSLVISPGILGLDVGDVMWWIVHNLSPSSEDMLIYSKSWFLMEYLG